MNLFNFLTDQIHICKHLWHVVVYVPWDSFGNDATGYHLNNIQRLAWAGHVMPRHSQNFSPNCKIGGV